jgi:hypothetical protein
MKLQASAWSSVNGWLSKPGHSGKNNSTANCDFISSGKLTAIATKYSEHWLGFNMGFPYL